MDFVLGLPKTHRRDDYVFFVMDGFREMKKFIPCKKTNDASQIVWLLFRDIVRIHGLPLEIVSDRDNKFIGNFWRTLYEDVRDKPPFFFNISPPVKWRN